MRILVTGVGGMMGSHLVELLIEKNHIVQGLDFTPTTNIEELNKKVKYIECDIRDKNKLTNILSSFKPEVIFHLAAQSYPAVSWDRPEYTIETNIIGTINLFEAVKSLKLDSIIINAGSSAIYGFVKEDEVPIKESKMLKPLHPYGVSKVAQEMLAYQYWENFKIKNVTIRIFNTTGPKKEVDVCADWTRQIVRIEKGLQKPVIRVGNLNSKRAITDVRDLIEALVLAVEKCEYGQAYNVSGESVYQMSEILEILKNLTKINFEVYQDPTLLRPTDEPIIYGDSTRFKQATGWKQKIEIKKTLQDMLEYWRKTL